MTAHRNAQRESLPRRKRLPKSKRMEVYVATQAGPSLNRITRKLRAEKGEAWWQENVIDDWKAGASTAPAGERTQIKARADAEWRAMSPEGKLPDGWTYMKEEG